LSPHRGARAISTATVSGSWKVSAGKYESTRTGELTPATSVISVKLKGNPHKIRRGRTKYDQSKQIELGKKKKIALSPYCRERGTRRKTPEEWILDGVKKEPISGY